MAETPAQVEGVEQAQAAYQGVSDDARDMTEPNRIIANAGADAARARAPLRTGRLMGSIDGSATPKSAVLTVGVVYWPYAEYGTRYVQGRRFGRAGREAMEKAAPAAYNDRMSAIIARRT